MPLILEHPPSASTSVKTNKKILKDNLFPSPKTSSSYVGVSWENNQVLTQLLAKRLAAQYIDLNIMEQDSFVLRTLFASTRHHLLDLSSFEVIPHAPGNPDQRITDRTTEAIAKVTAMLINHPPAIIDEDDPDPLPELEPPKIQELYKYLWETAWYPWGRPEAMMEEQWRKNTLDPNEFIPWFKLKNIHQSKQDPAKWRWEKLRSQ